MALHLAFSSADRLVRDVGPIVPAQALLVPGR
jgi:hypothetical protein